MTVRTPGPQELVPLEPAAITASPPVAQASSGVVVGGTLNGDVIVMSQRALAILRAGFLVHAFVISGLETLRRTIALSAKRSLRLENGIYQLV